MAQLNSIGIISTRIAGTDGVSLEIQKWVDVLEKNDKTCFYLAGETDRPKDRSLEVPEAHFEHEQIKWINQNVFGVNGRSRAVTKKIHDIKETLKDALYAFKERYHLDLIMPENALTIPMNIPLGLALTEFIVETRIPAIAHHHDFYWERDRFLLRRQRL